jgi:nucleoside-diphosphate-sugar epimerase
MNTLRHPIIEADLQAILCAEADWRAFAGATVLVTGAAGFLPAYMVETLLALNESRSQKPAKVIGLVRSVKRARDRFRAYEGRDDLSLIEQNVSQPMKDFGAIDYIVHAASQASPKFFRDDPVGTISANADGTSQLLQLAHQRQVKSLLYFSSAEVYGSTPARVPTRETDYGPVDCLQVRSCYAESKRLGETLCVAWHEQFGVNATIVRPFHTYGPRMRLDDGRVFADFVNDIVQRRSIVLKSAGTASRAFCYLADATRGFFTVLLRGQRGQAYNIGNDQAESTINDLADLLVELFPERGLSVVRKPRNADDPYLPSAAERTCPDVTLAQSLGWQPTTTLTEGFRRTVRSFE